MKEKLKSAQNHISHLETGSSTRDSKKTMKPSSRISYEKPTPLDFDAFVPWVCLEWQSPEIVVVTRVIQEEYIKHENRRSSSSRSKSTKSIKSKHEGSETITDAKKSVAPSAPSAADFMTRSSDFDSAVPVKAHYDTKGHLIEISIIGCPIEIHRKVIQAFSLCIPFHSLLTKLTIRKGGVTTSLLHEIGKMLPHSNLTDVCLDDCVLPEGNYEILLDQTSQLKYLSLNRCGINNSVCKNIANKIDFGSSGSSLLVLELGSNLISDRGAKAIAESLRRNRRLLHLNLSGNKITDNGAVSMLVHLMEFKLTWDEIVDARQRKLKYTEKKMEVYASCYEEVLKQQRAEMLTRSSMARKSFKIKSFKNLKKDKNKESRKNPSVFIEEKSAVDVAIAMTMDVVGEFTDPYDENSVEKKDECSHSKGNMVLCSLNLAYNNLSFISIRKIYEVLKYQNVMEKPSGATGLLRVVFYGNELPYHCVEYDRIEMFLKKVVNENAPADTSVVTSNTNYHKKRTISAPASKRSLKI